nr:MAG TPA: hypothetical protein [Caudoviricetes sp.]
MLNTKLKFSLCNVTSTKIRIIWIMIDKLVKDYISA